MYIQFPRSGEGGLAGQVLERGPVYVLPSTAPEQDARGPMNRKGT